MSETDNPPIDAFAELNLLAFKNTSPQRQKVSLTPKLEKEVIREAAEQSAFISRQPVGPKKKIVPRTFSLFQDECDIINMALRAYQLHPDERLSAPSSSDVVRAALHMFATLTPDDQGAAINAHRGRGRR
jgi:hypothetical protein